MSVKDTSKIKIESKKLTNEELNETLEVIVQAFKHDPFVKKYYNKYEDFRMIMELEIKYANDVGRFVIAMDDNKIVGVVVFLPPDVKPFSVSSLLNRKNFKMVINIVTKISFKTLRNMISVSSSFTKNKIDYCYYLLLASIKDGYRGAGIGRKMLQYTIDICDDGVPLYFESSNPKNNSLYKSLGFEVIGQEDDGVCYMVKK